MSLSGAADRRSQLGAALDAIRERVARAAAAAGRDPQEIRVIVVTKTYPASDVALLAGLGVRDVGENRVQEGAAKRAALADRVPGGLSWHLIGQLQTNKARAVARDFDCVHSVDRPELVEALDRATRERPVPLPCLVQVSLDGDPRRGGVVVEGLERLATDLAARPGLRLAGLMGVAPLGWNPEQAFDVLPVLSLRLREIDPTATMISAGMSGDLEAAVSRGATHLRVGSAVLGARPPLG